jgi:hypothetical protein
LLSISILSGIRDWPVLLLSGFAPIVVYPHATLRAMSPAPGT